MLLKKRKVATNLQEILRESGGTRDPLGDALFRSSRDTVLYTYLVDGDAYASGVQGLVDDLRAMGYRLSEFKNSWGSPGSHDRRDQRRSPSG